MNDYLFTVLGWTAYSGGFLQHIPQGFYDAASLLLVIVLLLALVSSVVGIVSSLLDIAMYAVLTVIAIGGLLFLTESVGLEGAIRMAGNISNIF